ncbi:hypothetical protein DFJ67_6988 [Asanoa ferruginea]|uniref:Uncharacterized protein n=1 Tax=Asanoa ferruginea TaxID=53367 RepID=A0A3D9ZU49_9ACTN|nr:CU044_5270 family protein [Asanoa ferruginea]REG00927.1 hypothetical protein DFJ67_6988 [Asanoa ferruginea]GIF47511.1 hypothetical protein Afe04nite_20500 [Asanoa ferruginea]
MSDADRIREIFAPADPIIDDDYVSDPERNERTLQAILATPRTGASGDPRRGVLTRRAWLAAAAIVAVAAVGAVVALAIPRTTSAAWAATPAPLAYQQPTTPQPAMDRLHALAASIAEHPHTPAPGGARDHLKIRSWALGSKIDGAAVTSVVIPTETETWRNPDNSGSSTTCYLEPEDASAAQLETWRDEGSPGADETPTQDRFPAGGFPYLWQGRPPSEPRALQRWLASTRQGANPATTIVSGLTDLLRERALTPAETSAALHVLADLPGLRYTGTITDRAGRTGDAYTATLPGAVQSGGPGLPITYTFIIDPDTGQILAVERVLETDVGKNNVTAPAVIGYDTYVVSELVAE